MKSSFKISLIFSVFLAFSACDGTDLDLQDNPNFVTPASADIDLYFNAIQLYFANATFSASDLAMPITRMRAMTGGNVYDNQNAPQDFNWVWQNTYSRFNTDANEMIATATEAELFVHVGAAKIMKAYLLMTMVDLFGDVPFSEANQGIEFQNPNADDDEAVYTAAKNMLLEAIDDLNREARALPSDDLIYGGDASAWIKAANSLLIRYYVNTRLVNSGSAAAINDIVTKGDYIQSNSEDFVLQYGTNLDAPDSRHPHYASDYTVDASYYQSNYYMWSLLDEKGFEDPRLRFYFYRQDCDTTDEDQFTLDCVNSPRPTHYTGAYPWCIASESGWWGRDHGNNDGIPPDGLKRTTFGVYPAGGRFDDIITDSCAVINPTTIAISGTSEDGLKGAGIQPVVLASYIDFMLAEVALAGGDAAGAATSLESGIRKSMDKVLNFAPDQVPAEFMPDQTAIDDYVTFVMDSYNSAASDDDRMNVIGKEYHIALWGQGLDAFNMYRRTGKPANMQPTREPDSGNFPRLFFYPADHVNLNLNARQRDPIDGEQVFWDTNAANPGWVN